MTVDSDGRQPNIFFESFVYFTLSCGFSSGSQTGLEAGVLPLTEPQKPSSSLKSAHRAYVTLLTSPGHAGVMSAPIITRRRVSAGQEESWERGRERPRSLFALFYDKLLLSSCRSKALFHV